MLDDRTEDQVDIVVSAGASDAELEAIMAALARRPGLTNATWDVQTQD